LQHPEDDEGSGGRCQGAPGGGEGERGESESADLCRQLHRVHVRLRRLVGLPARDAAALSEILYAEDAGTPLSPARLGERIGLTSGATTSLINRLEAAGYVVRTREHVDRRIVTLRYNPAAEAAGRRFFTPLGHHLDAMIVQYPAEQLDAIEAFLEHLRATMRSALADTPPT
jgi:DNA-binding MarR family transcriptional regulator